MNNNNPLLNLALLESLKGKKVADEVDLFVPYVCLAIHEIDTVPFEVTDVKEALKKVFGICPPEAALKVILTRAKKKGFIRVEHQCYYKLADKIAPIYEASRARKVELTRSLNQLIEGFISYAKDEHGTEISKDEASSFLYSFVKEHISEFAGILINNFPSISTKVKNKDYLTATYISYIQKHSMDRIPDLERIIKGVLLANYITYADKVSSKSQFSNMTVYFDTPIILGLLGYSGLGRERSLKEFRKLLDSLSKNIKVFDITVVEAKQLMENWKADLERKNYENFNSKTLELLRSKGIDSIALSTEVRLIEKRLKDLNIDIEYNYKIEAEHQCDEEFLQEELKLEGFKKNHTHDILCVSRVHNSRKSQPINSFNDTFSIFATLNQSLERVLNACLEESIGKDSIPVVSSERWLATVLWLKKPDLFQGIPFNLLLSSAYSTMYSDDKFWRNFISRMERIKKNGGISEEDFTLVRWDKSLMERILEVSIETGEDFKEEDIFDVIKRIKEEHDSKKNEELEELRRENAQAINILTIDKQNEELQTIALKEKIKNVSFTISHCIASCLALFLCYWVIMGIMTSLDGVSMNDFDINDIKKESIPIIGLIILTLMTLANLLFGSTVKGIYMRIQQFIYTKINSFFE